MKPPRPSPSPPDPIAVAASPPPPPPPPDAFRATGDTFARIPLHAIDPAPFNPKKPIASKYRKGLAASLEHFGVRDHLKVWPNPASPGRYIALDGNQRLDVLRELAEKRIGLGEVDPEDPGRDAVIRAIRAEAANSEVDCRILAELDPEDARLFTASFDRNHAAYDEGKVADLIAGLTTKPADLLKRLVRPEVAFVNPAPTPRPETAPTFAPPPPAEVSTPTEDEPWGPPPPDEAPGPVAASGYPVNAVPPRQALIPVMFSLTPSGYARLTEGILKSKARVVREPRLIAPLEALAAADDSVDLDDAVVELALRIVNDRMSILKADDDGE